MPDAAQVFAYTTTGTGGGTLRERLQPRRRRRATLPNTRTFTFTGADATGTKTITGDPAGGRLDPHQPRLLDGGTTDVATGARHASPCDPGDAVTCTYTNTQNASLDIEKQSVGGTATFDYAVNGSGLAPFTRDTAVANPTTNAPFPFTGLQLGTKDVQETPEPGFTLTNIVLRRQRRRDHDRHRHRRHASPRAPPPASIRATPPCARSSTAGDTPTCTFTNTAEASLDDQQDDRGR